jgi:cytochrome c biogenesis protein ResB
MNLAVKKTLAFFSSLKLTVFVVIILTALFIAGFFIPQKMILTPAEYMAWKMLKPELVGLLEAIGFTRIYKAPVTLFFFGLFFINLTVVFSRRVPVILRKTALPDASKVKKELFLERTSHVISFKGGEEAFQSVLDRIRDKGYTVLREGERFAAVRNRYAPLTTLFFHLSFFLFLIGALTAFYTKFSGKLVLGEGEVFNGNLVQYASYSLAKIGEHPEVSFKVSDIRPKTEEERATALFVDVFLENGEKRTININQPLKVGDTSFVIKNLGVAPLFIIFDSDLNEIDGAYVKLNVLEGAMDDFKMGGYQFFVRFFPDYKRRESIVDIALITDPAFDIMAKKDRMLVYDGIIRRGETATLNGQSVSFKDVPYWVEFLVVKERGVYLIYSGFVIGIAALTIRFSFPRREVKGIMYSGSIYVKGRSEFYQLQFSEDLRRIVGGFTDV